MARSVAGSKSLLSKVALRPSNCRHCGHRSVSHRPQPAHWRGKTSWPAVLNGASLRVVDLNVVALRVASLNAVALRLVSLEVALAWLSLLEVAFTFEVGGRARGVRVLNINQISLTSPAGANSQNKSVENSLKPWLVR